jgi:hypothetical protein
MNQRKLEKLLHVERYKEEKEANMPSSVDQPSRLQRKKKSIKILAMS